MEDNQNGYPVGTLTVGTTMEVKGINIDDYYFGIMRAMLTHKGLASLKQNGDFTGELAESWHTEDALTWTFKLKKGLTWHDGNPVTARDVKFSLEYLPVKSAAYKSHFGMIKTVQAPDDGTVVITLDRPNGRFLVNLLVLRVLPRHVFETVDDPISYNDEKAAIGCGPYIFDGYDQAAGIISFRANENYYRGRPNIRQIKFRLFKNPDTMYLALQKGEIDLPYFYAAGTDPLYVANLLKNKMIKVETINNSGVSKALVFNTQKPPVDKREFREAVSYAVNYQELLQIFSAGYGKVPCAGFVPRGSAGFIETRQMEYAPEKAKLILDQLGYSDSDGDGIREMNGKPLVLEVVVRNDLPEYSRIAELLEKYLGQVGIKLAVKSVDNALFRTISDKDKSHVSLLTRTTTWGMMMWGGYGSGYFDARNIGWSMLDDQAYCKIVDRLKAAFEQEEYKATGAEIQRYYAANLPAIPLYWDDILQPYKTDLEGWQVDPMYGFLNEESWYSLRKVDK